MYSTGLATFYAAMVPPVSAGERASDPLADAVAIVTAAYADGLATGEAVAWAALSAERELLQGLHTALSTALVIDAASLGPVFVQLVTSLAEAVVMAELALSPAIIASLVNAALGSVVVDTSVSVRLHPDDVAAANGCPVQVVAAPEMARGSIAVVGPSFVVHDGLAERLAATAAALG